MAAAVAVPGAAGAASRLARRLAGRTYVAAVGVVVADDSVLLARHTFRGHSWSLPGGWVRRREDPAAACAREIAEETGLDVVVVAVVGCDLHAIDGVPMRYGGITVAFGCRPKGPGRPDVIATSVELDDVQWHPIDEAMDLLTGFERAALHATRLIVS